MEYKIPPERKRRLGQLQHATKDIGDDPHARLAWLVDFARTDVTRFNDNTLVEYGDRLLAIGYGGWGAKAVDTWVAAPASASDVLSVHKAVKSVLEEVVLIDPITQRMDIPIAEVTTSFMRTTPKHHKPAIYIAGYRPKNLASAVLHALKDLVLGAGDRLVACKNCDKPIIANRKREYCNAACATAHRDHKAIKPRKEARHGKKKTRTR